jgi:erythromycin esterase-like protein
VPQTLLSQLTVGGRLIIPVGRRRFRQTLCRVTRRGEVEYEQDDLGAVAFVPLIGEHGWAQDGRRSTATRQQSTPRAQSLPEMIAQQAQPLPDIEDADFARWVDRYADRRVVLLGESTHGTSEFYRARAAITRRLITEHGFTIVAAEADWPDAAAVDRYIRHRPALARTDAEPPFQRFPTWMWRNLEFQQLVDWLREHNESRDPLTRVGFYGLDLYNLSASIAAVLDYLDNIDPEAAAVARQRYGCLTPWQKEPSTYGRAVLTSGYQKCERAVIEVCRALLLATLVLPRWVPYAKN